MTDPAVAVEPAAPAQVTDAPARRMLPETGSRAWAVALTLASLLVWWGWASQQDCHPYHDLSCGTYTDHFSHMNTGRLFTEVGADVWRKPLRENGRPLTAAEVAALPADMRALNPDDMRTFDGWPPDKPFISSWNINPRFHPPGDMLLTAPVALLYSFTSLSFSQANLLLILLFLLYVHVPIYLLLRGIRPGPQGRRAAGFLVVGVAYFELVHWALEGFYEGLVVAPLLLSLRAAHRRDGTSCLFWFSVGSLLHFRALFLLPVATYGLYLIIRQREWRTWRQPGPAARVAATAVLGLAAAIPFLLLWPSLHTIQVTNAINPSAQGFGLFKLAPLVVTAVVAGAALASARAWLDLAVLAWVCLLLLSLREALFWDGLTLLAWIAAPASGRSDLSLRVRDARIFVLLCVSAYVFHTSLTPDWFAKVAGGLAAR